MFASELLSTFLLFPKLSRTTSLNSAGSAEVEMSGLPLKSRLMMVDVTVGFGKNAVGGTLNRILGVQYACD